MDPRALSTKMEKHAGIVSFQFDVELINDDGDISSTGDASCTSIDLDDYENLCCSTDFHAPDDVLM